MANWGGHLVTGIAVVVVAGLILGGLNEVGHGMVDISWPNCNRLPGKFYERAVIGVSGGLDFHPNICLGNEVRTTAVYGLYANTGNPGFPRIRQLGRGPLKCSGGIALVCHSYDYGYNAGLYALRQAKLSAANSPEWWLDVEEVNSWTNSINANRADIAGMIDALRSVPFLKNHVGIYTTTNQWVAIVGNWNLNLPLWLGTGATNKTDAKKACMQKPVTGSKIVLTQYTIGKQDYNYVCSYWAKPKYF